MLIDLILIIRYLKSDTPPITTTQFLNFIEEKNPTTSYTTRLKKEVEQNVDLDSGTQRQLQPRPQFKTLDCRVCLSEFVEGEKVRSLNCDHTFHKDCLDNWFLQEQFCAATCPLCRNKVLPDDVVAKYHHHLVQNQVEYDENDDQLFVLLSVIRGGSTLHRYL